MEDFIFYFDLYFRFYCIFFIFLRHSLRIMDLIWSNYGGPSCETDGSGNKYIIFKCYFFIFYIYIFFFGFFFVFYFSFLDMSQSLDEEDMDVSNDVNAFCGFTDEDIELSTSKAHKFSFFFMSGWLILMWTHYGLVGIIKICSFLYSHKMLIQKILM